MKAAYDAKIVRTKAYKQFDAVWLFDPSTRLNECAKLKRKWLGPFIIWKVLPNNNHMLKHMITGKFVINAVHSDRLKSAFIRGYVPQDREVSEGTVEATGATTQGSAAPTEVNMQGVFVNSTETTPRSVADAPEPPDTAIIDTTTHSHAAQPRPNAAPGEAEKTDDAQTGETVKINETQTAGATDDREIQTPPLITTRVDPQSERAATDVGIPEVKSPARPRLSKATDTNAVSGKFYAAEKLLKQKRLNGETLYLVKWCRGPNNEKYPDTWTNSDDVTQELKTQFYISHLKNGTLRAAFRRKPTIRPR